MHKHSLPLNMELDASLRIPIFADDNSITVRWVAKEIMSMLVYEGLSMELRFERKFKTGPRVWVELSFNQGCNLDWNPDLNFGEPGSNLGSNPGLELWFNRVENLV